MSRQRKNITRPKNKFDYFTDLFSKRISKITLLVTLIGGLAYEIANQWERIYRKAVEIGLYTPPPCAEVVALKTPDKVKYSEWDDMTFEVEGRSNCSTPLGLYVTFVRRSATEPRFVLKVPHEDLPECKGSSSFQEPKCWDPKKPVSTGKGPWNWRVPSPPLVLLSEPVPNEKVIISWAVYDYDTPTKPAIGTGNATINLYKE
jgi:hypothetical protein